MPSELLEDLTPASQLNSSVKTEHVVENDMD
jgi:hypothetical protein